MSSPPPIFVITGQLSAGKSTVAGAILERHSFGYHVDVPGIREMVTSGRASPLEWNDETTRQFNLAIEASAALAGIYSSAGFAVAIEGGLDPESSSRWQTPELPIASSASCYALAWRSRCGATGNDRRNPSTPRSSKASCDEIDGDLANESDRPAWHVLDNSDEPVEATVQRVLSFAR